jgi:metal-dependent HD superfamily phosphatase/phosphodiesterase
MRITSPGNPEAFRGKGRADPGPCPVCGTAKHTCVGDAPQGVPMVAALTADYEDIGDDMVRVKHDIYATVYTNSKRGTQVLVYAAGTTVSRAEAERHHAVYAADQSLRAMVTEVK